MGGDKQKRLSKYFSDSLILMLEILSLIVFNHEYIFGISIFKLDSGNIRTSMP